jgi:hypothetical protein
MTTTECKRNIFPMTNKRKGDRSTVIMDDMSLIIWTLEKDRIFNMIWLGFRSDIVLRVKLLQSEKQNHK